MQCPSCQTINPPQAKFCLECGYRLSGCPNCGTLNPPQARFCIECGTPLQPRRNSAQTPPAPLRTTDVRATQPMSVVSPAEIQQPTTIVDVESPEAILQTTASVLSPSAEERRIVTVMFADITGSTPLADRLDPEDMRAILTGYFNLMTEQIRKYDGTVEKYIGDAVMAVFGTPVTHEDDPDRAIRAALDMQQALTLFNQQRLARDPEATRLQMRIGINTGEVAAPANTATQYQDFLVTGDAVNIAARLQQNAAPDAILVGERTYLATRDVFQFQDMAPLRLKGKPEPINAYVVRGLYQQTTTIMQHPRGILGNHTPLIGRNLELTLLHASYARVQAERRTHLITVLGAPGIGKSRLVREFIAREQELAKNSSALGKLHSPRVLKGRCPPYGEGITYWPLVEILRALLNVQDNDTNQDLQQRLTTLLRDTFAQTQRTESAEEIADTLLRRTGRGLINNQEKSDLLPGYSERMKPEPQSSSSARTDGAQGALLRSWRVLLEALGELQPLIIVVDDLQWADEALLDLLEYLTDRIVAVPILFLCPARPDFLEHRRDWGGGHRNFTAIELDALTDEESNELVDALLNTHDFPEVLRYSIRTRSEGNPFFVEEIVRMFIDQGILVREKDQERGQDYWRIEYPRFSMLEEPVQHTDLPEQDEEGIVISSHFIVPLPYVPDTIQGVLAARVDLLEPAEKLILQYGAVIGRTFWLSLLIEMSEHLSPETILEGLVSLIRRDFIVENTNKIHSPVTPDRSFNFKHILIRDVVYNNIPRLRRSREHARIALWIEEQTQQQPAEFVELVAFHYQQALATWSPSSTLEYIELRDIHHPALKTLHLTRDELRQRTITALTMTGDQALHSYYGLRALRAYNDAYELLNDGNSTALDKSRMLAKIGDASTQRGNLDEAWKHYRRALQLITDQNSKPAETAEMDRTYLLSLYERLSLLATRWRARFDAPPDPQEIRRDINAGLQLLEGTSSSREYIAFLTYEAFWYIRLLEDAPGEEKDDLVERALQSGHRALTMAEELNNPRTLSLTLDAMGFIYFVYHRYTRAQELQDRRLELVHLINDKEELFDLYISLGGVYEQVGEYAQALSFYGLANSYALTMESPAMVLNAMIGRMRVWRRWNRWDETQKVAQEILQFIEKYQQDEKRQLWALEALATIAYHRGQHEQGDEYARQFKRLTDQQMASTKQVASNTRMHAINLAQENWTHALSDYQEKVRRSEPFPDPEVLATLAELMVTTGQDTNTEALCERAVSLNESSGARKSLAVALRARGRFRASKQHWEEAEADLRNSLSLCEKLDLPWESAHTLYQLGRFYAQRALHEDDRSGRQNSQRLADTYLERALGFYESLQAPPAIARTRAALEKNRAVMHTSGNTRDALYSSEA